LKELQAWLSPAETIIALNARKPEFPVSLLPHSNNVRFAKVFDGSGADRFIHAKAIIVEAGDCDHLLLGSTNCSTNALGSFDGPAANAEASMYRRLPAGTAVSELGVDLGQSIDPALITTVPKERKPPAGPAIPWPGSIEAAGKAIRWRPAPDLAQHADGAQLKISDCTLPFARERDGLHFLELPQLPSYPMIARILLADGRVTSPVLVNDELRLQQAAPGMGNRKLRAALERIELGESDLLDLAALAALIFSTPEKARPVEQRSGGAKGGSKNKDAAADTGRDYNSPEDFRAAMELASPARGEDHRLNIHGPDEVSLFRIIMRGMSPDPEDDLLAAENEPDEDDDHARTPLGPPAEPACLPRRVFTGAQVEKRRVDVLRAMKAFETHLTDLAKSEVPPPRKITAETCFILRLMVEASRRAMLCGEDDKQSEIYALPLAPNAVERDDTFVIRAGRMLHKLWVGTLSQRALLRRLQIGRHFDELPYECFAVVVMSRWAAARCVTSMSGSRYGHLTAIVTQTALQIWRATAAWPTVDSAAELDFVRRLDQALGIASSDTDELVGQYGTLTESLMRAAQAAE
jgi:hypothetical protein